MKRTDITEKTRENIVSAFWRLYKTKPIEQISINQLMQTAGYHRSTFYLYFNSIYDVLSALEDDILDDIRQVADAVKNQTMPSPTEDVLHFVAELYGKNSEYVIVLLGPKGDPAFAEKAKHALRPLVMSNIKNQTLPLGTITPENEELIFEYISSTILNMIHFYLKSGNQTPLEEFIITIRTLIFTGLVGLQHK